MRHAVALFSIGLALTASAGLAVCARYQDPKQFPNESPLPYHAEPRQAHCLQWESLSERRTRICGGLGNVATREHRSSVS
jgi:hypothetical protein